MALAVAGCASSDELRREVTGSEPADQRDARSGATDQRPTEPPLDDPPTEEPSAQPRVQPEPERPRDRPAMPLPNVVGRIGAFTLPSGNIGCRLVATEARCDIIERSYRLPPKPASCDLDYGRALSIVVGARQAGFVCHGDTVLGARRVLAYGESTVVGDVGCTSSEVGVYCYDLLTGTGFQLRRESTRFF